MSVRNSGLSGRGVRSALAAGRSTEISTVASGAAIMKMISSTRITSMNGVTLISWTSSSSSPPWSRRTLMAGYSAADRAPAVGRALLEGAAIEIAADDAQDLGGGVGVQRAIAGDPAREHVVHHHRRDRRDQAERGRQQRLGDAGRDHREIGGVRLRDADEAVHDAPHGAEQADEGRGGADGGEDAGAADHRRGRRRPRAAPAARRCAP